MKPPPHAWAASTLGLCLLLGCATARAPLPSPAGPARPVLALGVEKKNFDLSVRPQDDFYHYVNGTWLKTHPVPADKSAYGTFRELRDKSDLAVRELIQQAASAPGRAPGSDAQKVGDFYASFMDTARIESAGLAPLREDLQHIAALQGREQLPELFATLTRLGVQLPFRAQVSQDLRHAEHQVAYLHQDGLGLPDRDYYSKQEPSFVAARTAYVSYIETLLRLAGDPAPAEPARAILALETALAQKHWENARLRDLEAAYNPRSVAELEALTPGFSWTRYLKATGLDASSTFIVGQPDYLQAMGEELTRLPLPVLQSYLRFKLLDEYADLLSSPFEQASFAFNRGALQGLKENPPRWQRAVKVTNRALGEVIGRLYVARYFPPESKARVEQLVKNLLAAFHQSIEQSDWMSPQTKAQAQAKLAGITVKIGYPERWRDYSGLTVDPSDLVGNARRSAAFEFQYRVDKLGKPVDRLEFYKPPQVVNAGYSPTLNSITFMAAILQPPFFDPQADDATNYGGIGGIIGHEISHGFDDMGSRFDGAGNMREWWTPEDKATFQQRTHQLAAQYSAFSPLPGLNIDGKATLGENIGDLSGLTMAFRAWQRSLGGQPAPVIDGFTGEQRFFLGWAQAWRENSREDATRQQLLSDPHPPDEYRVRGVVRNMPAFSSAFDVKPGDREYLPPDQRVSLW